MQLIYRLLLAGLLLGAGQAQAQRVLLGLKGGATIANGIGKDALGSSLRFGAHGGGLLRINLTEHLALQGEGLYAQRGDNSTVYGRTINHRLDYVDVPLLLQYHQQDLFVEAGAQLSWLRQATPTSKDAAIMLNQLTFQEQERSFVVGFGYQDSSGVTVGWRYVGGLSNVYRPGQISGSGQVQLRNSTVEFYLAYVFAPRQIIRLVTSPARLIGKLGKGKKKASRRAAPTPAPVPTTGP
jgi:hypothetical protein